MKVEHNSGSRRNVYSRTVVLFRVVAPKDWRCGRVLPCPTQVTRLESGL